jgi:hypothetical protein
MRIVGLVALLIVSTIPFISLDFEAKVLLNKNTFIFYSNILSFYLRKIFLESMDFVRNSYDFII